MQKITLEPAKYPKGKYLRIEFVSVEWDEGRRAFAAMVMFHRTRDTVDAKVLGTILYANNQETMAKMLKEYNLLYPVRERTVIGIPEQGDRVSCTSHAGYAQPYIQDLRKPTDSP